MKKIQADNLSLIEETVLKGFSITENSRTPARAIRSCSACFSVCFPGSIRLRCRMMSRRIASFKLTRQTATKYRALLEPNA